MIFLLSLKKLKIESKSILKSEKWILMGYSIGQRVSDLLELSIDNVRQANNNGLYIDINQKKTGKFVTVGIVDKIVIDIILNSFPHKIYNSKFNQDIKKIAEYLNVSIKSVEAHITKAFSILRKSIGNKVEGILFLLFGSNNYLQTN